LITSVFWGLLLLKQSYDVIVVGAGSAEAALAYELVKKGIEVLLLEKERLPRYKCCAGGVTAKAAKLLDFDISEVAEDVIYEVDFTFDLGSPDLGQHSWPLIYTVIRDAFEHFLVRNVQQLGAALIDGQRVTEIRINAEWVEISTADSIFCP
jgi:flavin-dependent dehydrogenase